MMGNITKLRRAKWVATNRSHVGYTWDILGSGPCYKILVVYNVECFKDWSHKLNWNM